MLDGDFVDILRSYENPVVLSKGLSRVLLTRTDVLHSLGIPRLGVKLDSSPGRLNTTMIEVMGQGLLSGSCYELCGRGHRAIPVIILCY